MEILVAAGAMEEETLKVMPLGLVARSLQVNCASHTIHSSLHLQAGP